MLTHDLVVLASVEEAALGPCFECRVDGLGGDDHESVVRELENGHVKRAVQSETCEWDNPCDKSGTVASSRAFEPGRPSPFGLLSGDNIVLRLRRRGRRPRGRPQKRSVPYLCPDPRVTEPHTVAGLRRCAGRVLTSQRRSTGSNPVGGTNESGPDRGDAGQGLLLSVGNSPRHLGGSIPVGCLQDQGL